VGRNNIFIFGLPTDEVARLQAKGYKPWDFYNAKEIWDVKPVNQKIVLVSGGSGLVPVGDQPFLFEDRVQPPLLVQLFNSQDDDTDVSGR